DVEFEVTGARQGGDELEAVAVQQMGEPGMRHQVGQPSHLPGDRDAAAAGEIRLDHVHATCPFHLFAPRGVEVRSLSSWVRSSLARWWEDTNRALAVRAANSR